MLVSHVVFRSEHIIIGKDLGAADTVGASDQLRVVPFGQRHVAGIRTLAARVGLRSALPAMHFSLEQEFAGLVALQDGAVVGYAWYVTGGMPRAAEFPQLVRYGLRLDVGDVYLHHLFLDPRYRGEGRATEFLRQVHDHLRALGLRRVIGFVEATNLQARTLYRMLGWRETDRYPVTRLLRMLLIVRGRWFLKNISRTHAKSFDFRPLFPRR